MVTAFADYESKSKSNTATNQFGRIDGVGSNFTISQSQFLNNCSHSRCFSGRQGDVLYTLLCYFNKSLKVNETDSATAVLIFSSFGMTRSVNGVN